MFSHLLRHPGMQTECDYSGRMGRDEKQQDRWSTNKKEIYKTKYKTHKHRRV